jgi:hypothetical protein
MGLLSFKLLNKNLTCYFFFLYAHTQKWQNCQRAEVGHILVEVEEVERKDANV